MLDDQFTSAANEQTGQNIYNLAVQVVIAPPIDFFQVAVSELEYWLIIMAMAFIALLLTPQLAAQATSPPISSQLPGITS